jgi:arylsulfatase A-like enzyme
MFSGAHGEPVIDGTFSLPMIGNGGPLGPDLLVTFAWNDDLSEHQQRGMSAAHRPSSAASHGGASAWEVRNTLILAGPGVRQRARSTVSSGSIDLAPTVLGLLGLPAPSSMTGRVLTEALDGSSTATAADADAPPTYERIETGAGPASLSWAEVAGSRYLDAAWIERTGA